jgi:tetratricopeptide (TPR) repeat protein
MSKIISFIQILCFILLTLIAYRLYFPPKAENWTAEQQRALAINLRTKGLDLQAAKELQKYLSDYQIPAKERPGVCVTIGNIYYDKLDFANAVAYYYRAEALDPTFANDKDVPKRVVDSLTKLGRQKEAAAARKRYTELDPSLAEKETEKKEVKEEAKVEKQEEK